MNKNMQYIRQGTNSNSSKVSERPLSKGNKLNFNIVLLVCVSISRVFLSLKHYITIRQLG